MTNTDIYPCYVKIVDDIESDDILELPTEENGSILLSTVQAQYPNATGLRYKSEAGSWRGIRLSGNVLDPPEEGWGEREFFITLAKQDTFKRKTDSSYDGPMSKRKTTEEDLLSDLIVLGLSYAATEDDLKTYFEQFGELSMHEIKKDSTGKSKGFGFIRYTSAEAAQEVLKLNHNVGGRRCDVRLPKKQPQPTGYTADTHMYLNMDTDEIPRKLFIGRLKEGTTMKHLEDHFSAYGTLTDVYVPKTFRGFGFITFDSQEAAQAVLDTSHIIQGSCVNITYADPKGVKNNLPAAYSSQQVTYGNYPGYNTYNPGYSNQYVGYTSYSATQQSY